MIETYAAFVWSCYGIVAFVLALNFWLARRSHAEELKTTRRRQLIRAEQTE